MAANSYVQWQKDQLPYFRWINALVQTSLVAYFFYLLVLWQQQQEEDES